MGGGEKNCGNDGQREGVGKVGEECTALVAAKR